MKRFLVAVILLSLSVYLIACRESAQEEATPAPPLLSTPDISSLEVKTDGGQSITVQDVHTLSNGLLVGISKKAINPVSIDQLITLSDDELTVIIVWQYINPNLEPEGCTIASVIVEKENDDGSSSLQDSVHFCANADEFIVLINPDGTPLKFYQLTQDAEKQL